MTKSTTIPGWCDYPTDLNPDTRPSSHASSDESVLPTEQAPWHLYSTWRRWFFVGILTLVTTSNYFDFYVLSIVLDPIKQEFHATDAELGLLGGFFFSFCYAFASLPIARYADRGNRRTVIAAALAVWSGMTAICGTVQSFSQLVLARVGVGLAEPGATPPAQSLVADYFPPEKRALALTIVTQCGAGLGGLLGVGIGGFIAARYGWRAAFLWAGVPGLVLAGVVLLTLSEPRRVLITTLAGRSTESVRQTLHKLVVKRSYVLLVAGSSVYSMFSFAATVFIPSYMQRSLHVSLYQVSAVWGIDVTIADTVGALVAGIMADRLGARDVRWYAWLPTLLFIIGGPLYWLAFYAKGFWEFTATVCCAEALMAGGVAVVFAAIHTVCGPARRAMAIATLYFAFYISGGGFGPAVAGEVSDLIAVRMGADSLKYSLMVMLLVVIPAIACFYFSSRYIAREQEHELPQECC